MTVEASFKSEYHTALTTLRQAIEQCPDALWTDPAADGLTGFWRVAYHALYHMHFRLQIDERSFTPWERHRDGAQHLEKFAGKNERSPTACEPYTRDDTLEYLRVCDGMIDTGVDAFDIERGDWNAPSRQMLNKLAQNRVNILVIQRHARSLAARLRRWVGEGVEWLGSA